MATYKVEDAAEHGILLIPVAAQGADHRQSLDLVMRLFRDQHAYLTSLTLAALGIARGLICTWATETYVLSGLRLYSARADARVISRPTLR